MSESVTVGAHPWVYAAGRPGHDITGILDDIFADMAHAGLEGIELMHTALGDDGCVERISGLSERHGLAVIGSSWGGPLWDRARHADTLADAEAVLRRLAAVGGRTLGVTLAPTGRKKTADQLDAQADALDELMARCDAHGVTANLHNHTWEVADDLHELRGMIDRVPQARLGPDLNWLLRAGVDPAWFLREFAGRVVFLHLRDQHADGRWTEALGEGDTDFAAIADALADIHFAGPAVIELAHEPDFTPTRPLRESLAISRRFLRHALGH